MALADIEENNDSKGKLPVDSDFTFAIEEFKKEQKELLSSYQLAKAIENAGNMPDDLISYLREQDAAEVRDRQIALSMTRNNESDTARILQRSILHNRDACMPSSSNTRASKNSSTDPLAKHAIIKFNQVKNKAVECNSCLTERTDAYHLECGHAYCKDCSKSLCTMALNDRGFIPIRCCKILFPKEIIIESFSDSDLTKYSRFLAELEAPAANVSEFDLNLVMSGVINEKGWKICPRCGAVIEKKDGCIHITCICKHEFCYTCRKNWLLPNKKRVCTCELFSPDEINRILNERAIPNNGKDRDHLRNVLRNYYDHAHNWVMQTSGTQVCNQCSWQMPSFSMICDVCREVRCRRCTFNL